MNSAADGSTMYPLMVFFYNLYLQLLDDLKRGSIVDPYHIMGAVMLNILFASIVEKNRKSLNIFLKYESFFVLYIKKSF